MPVAPSGDFGLTFPIQWLPRIHWAAWSIRQEGSTPVVIHQVVVVETLAESRVPMQAFTLPGNSRVPLNLRARLHSNTPHAGQTRSTKHQRLGASPTSPSAWHIGFVPFRFVAFDDGRPLASRVESRRPQNHISLAARSRCHALPHPSSPGHQPISLGLLANEF